MMEVKFLNKNSGKSLDEVKKEKIEHFDNICNKQILSGFRSNTTGYFYEFEYEDQINMTQQMLILVSDPTITEIIWKIKDGGVVLHTRDDFITVCREAETFKRSTIEKYWSYKEQILNAATIEEVEAIVWE